MKSTYLDWAATSIPDNEIIEGMAAVTRESFGNPSSQHQVGTHAATILHSSRTTIAELLGVDPSTLIFTSGGTEANNIIFSSLLFNKQPQSLVISGIEHPSVYEPAQQLKQFGKTVHVVSANRNGFVGPQKIADRIDPQTTLVSVMLVNNETGAIQPLEQICSCIREKQREMGTSIHIHSDMVQALGKIPLALNTLDIDSATFSGHKLCAPRGVGLLYLRKPVPVLHRGGEQEFRLRPGTENLPGIWAFSQAAKKYLPSVAEHNKEAWRLKNLLRTELSETGFCEFIEEEGSPHYSPFITSILIPPAPGEVIVRVMSDKGYALSTGAACSTSQKKRTRTLENMGIERAKAFSAIRISIGYTTSKEDIRSFVHTLKQEIPPLLKIAT